MNKKDIIENLEKDIKNLSPKIIDEFFDNNPDIFSMGLREINRLFRDIYGLTVPINRTNIKYWELRGWDTLEANKKLYEVKQLPSSKRKSPFDWKTWFSKGYSEEDAKFKANSMRPIRKEYWIKKGYSEDDAIQKANDTKKSNDIKGNKKSVKGAKNKEWYQNTQKEYYIVRGYSEDEAIKKLSERQSTFSLEKCELKYGKEEGFKVWEKRQKKWLNSINNLSNDEKKIMNKKKNIYSKWKKIYSLDEFKQKCIEKGVYIPNSVDELIQYLDEKFMSTYKIYWYKTADEVWNNYLNDCITHVMNEHKDVIISHIDKRLKEKPFDKGIETKFGKIFLVDEGVLRSSHEKYFYDRLKELGIENIEIDSYYPNSKLRFDFKVDNDYIEICPMYNQNSKEDYTIKMDMKHEKFGSILLESKEDMDKYLESL